MKVFAYTNDITVFLSHFSDITALQLVFARYEMSETKINSERSEGLQLSAYEGSIPLPVPFH